MICFGILIMFCNPSNAPVADSFCQVYQQVVLSKGDSSIAAGSNVKRRILANELTYRKVCQGK
jgi:hypothetical protein